MNFNALHPADQICEIMKRIYDMGMTTVSGGNLSIRDGEGNIWISPSGLDKGALNRSDVSKILPDGTIVGRTKVSLETPIHQLIMKVRPDIKAVFHAHPPAMVTMCLTHTVPNIKIYPHLKKLSGGSVEVAPYALPGSDMLAKNIAEIFEKGCNSVIMENHGVFIGSTKSLDDAFRIFEALDFVSRTQLVAPLISGQQARSLSDAQIEKYEKAVEAYVPEEFVHDKAKGEELLLRKSIAQLSRRAYRKQIFCGVGGSISARVDEHTFIITPAEIDKSYMEPDMLVAVKDGKREMGKMPDFTAKLHALIYKNNPNLPAIIIAAPPRSMAYAVTDNEYNMKLSPECYNRLRSSKKFSLDTLLENPEAIANYISPKTPTCIIENFGFVITAIDPFMAFDRVEILEFTSMSMLYAKAMRAEIKPMPQDQIDALDSRFKIKMPVPVDLDLL